MEGGVKLLDSYGWMGLTGDLKPISLKNNKFYETYVWVVYSSISNSLMKALQTLKSEHFDTESSQVWQ